MKGKMFFPCIYDLYFSFSFFSKYIHERFLSKIIYSYICSKFHEISFSSFELRVYINKIIYKFLVARMASDSDTRTIGNRDTLIFHVVIDKASIKLIISIQPCELIHRSNDLLFLPTFVSRNFVNSIRDPSFLSLSLSFRSISLIISHSSVSRSKTKLIDEKFFHYSFLFVRVFVRTCMNVLFRWTDRP